MKKIKVHGLVTDNAGDQHDAGAVLTVSDDAKAGCIAAVRAAHLVAIASAEEVAERAARPASAD